MSKIKSDYSQLIVHVLLNAINDDTNIGVRDIAINTLINLEQLKGASLEECALTLHISESSLKRFCQKIGFHDFTTFRKMLNSKVEIYENTDFFQNEMLDINYVENIKSSIQCIDEINPNLFYQVANDIFESEKVYISTYSGFKCHLLDFQESMYMHNKLIYLLIPIIDYPKTIFSKNDCLIVLSLNGGFYNGFSKEIDAINCKKILITHVSDKNIINKFDYVLNVSATEIKSVQKYMIQRVFEKILVAYHELYSSKSEL